MALMNTYPEWIATLDTYRQTLGDEALQQMHIHLSGIAYGPKGEKNHLVMEEADRILRTSMRALHDSGRRAVAASCAKVPQWRWSAAKFKALWQEVSGEEQ